MQLGKMYLVKEFFWFLFPTKELAVRCPTAKMRTYHDAKWLSEYYKCNVAVVEKNTYVVLLEVDNGYIKLLDCNGNIGWIRCSAFFDYFELVKE